MNWKETVLGIELGSTRIKAVLLDREHRPLASGSFEWENQLVNGLWTYSLERVRQGLQACYAMLKQDVAKRYGETLHRVGALGISGMMHGYLPFDEAWQPLVAFRTWRNTVTGPAAAALTELFGFNIPQRWSVAHLYQAVLNREEHVEQIAHLTTLAGYVHHTLTGVHALGIGEASGMFPIDSEKKNYHRGMLEQFDRISGQKWKIEQLLPKVLLAGEPAGCLTPEGALFLDPQGDLEPGIPLVPCEGDAGTGMAATNSVRPHTGNVSAGTSDFAMLVTDRPLGVHREIDMVTTPAGMPVAMVHCNNCTSDINAWAELLMEFAQALGVNVSKGELFTLLFRKALEGDAEGAGLLSCNYFSGEGVTDLDAGRPLFARTPEAALTLPNFMRVHLMSALATLKIGLDILTQQEGLPIEKLYGHGGFFKTPEVGQRMLSAAVNAPVSVMETAGEGGPYGMALLAAYGLWRQEGESLEDYLDNKVFARAASSTLMATEEEIQGFNRYLERYQALLAVERTAIREL